MKRALLLATILMGSLSAHAGFLDVDCGEIHKVKQKKKQLSPFGFPLNMIITLGRADALKVKLKNSTTYMSAADEEPTIGEEKRRSRSKRAYTNPDNYNDHLKQINEAIELKEVSKRPVYVCYGKVAGLDRWHNVLSVSQISKDDALDELIRKYE